MNIWNIMQATTAGSRVRTAAVLSSEEATETVMVLLLTLSLIHQHVHMKHKYTVQKTSTHKTP